MTSRCLVPASWSVIGCAGAFFAAALLPLRAADAPDAAAPSVAVLTPPAEPSPVVPASHLTLDDAIALALAHNQQIKVGSYNPQIGRAGVLAAYGRFDPAITFRRSYGQSYSENTGPSDTQFIKDDEYSLQFEGLMPWGLTYQIGGTASNQRGTANFFTNNYITFGGVSVTQPLLRGFGFGATLADLRIAKANRVMNDWQYRQTVIDTVTAVVTTYESLAEARENLKIAERARGLATQLVTDNEKRNKVGSIADADVTQARAQAASTEEGMLFARRGVHDLENRLRQLTGEGTFQPDGPEIIVDPLTPAAPMTVDGAADLRRALELRPDYQMARAGITRLRATDAQARNQVLPQLDFVGSYGYSGFDPSFAASRAQVRDHEHRAYSAGMVVSVPLTFAQSRGRARQARFSLRQSEADLVRLEQDIALSLASAIGQLETTSQRIEVTTRAYDLAQQALDAEEKRFKAGTSNTIFVLQFQQRLIAAQAAKIAAVADQRRAIANYEHEIGTTLEVYHLKLQ